MKWYVVQINSPDGEAKVSIGPFDVESDAIKELDKQTRLNGKRLPRGFYWTWRQQTMPFGEVRNQEVDPDLRK